eukprot:TRINITY_DN8627_c0_g1_i1.p1 TRINITY_DN8627_c0_g1~~TRINITY_DN8627_c0_g1_i1.p1  ORF type:complete len:425 (-),score=150.83 TRINITY_DN8627_c0_g1_i1:95-1288(-)
MAETKKVEEKLDKHVPYGKEGSGYYSEHTIGCFDVMERGKSLVLSAVKDIMKTKLKEKEEKKNPQFAIVDFGCADAGTSLPLWRDVVGLIRKEEKEANLASNPIPIVLIYEDQPINDFKSVFLRTQGRLKDDRSGGKIEDENLFCFASGTSFYDKCTPPNFVDLAFSSTAMHWLSHRPCNLSSCVHSTSAQGEEKKKFAEQARADWQRILENRVSELKSNGRFICINFCVDENGYYLGKSPNYNLSMYDVMTEIWKKMEEEKLITSEEFLKATYTNYYRTKEEFSLPFQDSNNELVKKGLRLLSIQSHQVVCPFHQKWLREGEKGGLDPKRHGKEFIASVRTWSNSTFFSALDERRTNEEREKLIDLFFERYGDQISSSPASHGMDYFHYYLDVKKE